MTAPASPVAPAPAAPSVPVSAVPTAPVPSVPVIPLPATPVAPIPGNFFFALFPFLFTSSLFSSFFFIFPCVPLPFIAGPLPTIPSQFEVGSSSHVAIPDDAASFFVRFDQLEVNDLDPPEFWASGPPMWILMAFESLRTVFRT